MAKKQTKKKTKQSSSNKISFKHSVYWGVTPSGFKRMSISYKKTTINFKINPDEYTYKRPSRGSLYRTQNANVIQQFGADIARIELNGTTGYHVDGGGLNGRERLEQLNKLILDYQTDTQNGGHSVSALKFNNYTDHKHYTVTVDPESEGLKITRSKSNPLLYNYSLTLAVIGGDDTPRQESSVTGTVGTGAGSSIDKGAEASNSMTGSSNLVSTITDPHATKQNIARATKKLKKGHGK